MTPVKRIEPGPGQESVWDYPRPAICEPTKKRIVVEFGGITLADSSRAMRALETSHPPVYYLPPGDVATDYLEISRKRTVCEWKGFATYYTVAVGERVAMNAAYAYHDPTPGFERMMGFIAFYPAPMDACLVDGEKATPQPGQFYGGWITSDIVGPFKGEPGTEFW